MYLRVNENRAIFEELLSVADFVIECLGAYLSSLKF